MKRPDLRELEVRHHALDMAIRRLERRGNHMTPEDQLRASELKKQRLAAKDQLYAMRLAR